MATKFILDAPYLKNSKIALALSGGRDSMALAYALKAQGTPFFAINFEHGIRGDKSVKDSQFVRAWCKKNGVECLSITLDTPTYAKEKGLTIEQGARELRYFHFDKLLQEGRCDYIVLAHHNDDQVETILMRLFRGTGVRGLKGMSEVSGKYVRPLINYTREDIDKYVNENNIPFVEDETNKDEGYTRNYIRSQLKELKKRFPTIGESIARLSRSATEIDEYLLAQIGDIEMIDGECTMDISEFDTPAVAKRKILAIFEKLGVRQDVEERHYPLIFDLASAENGKKIDLPHGIVAHKDGEKVVFSTLTTPDDMKEIPFEGKTIEGVITVTHIDKFEKGDDLAIDLNKVPKQAVLRHPREKDKIRKFGGGSKSLGDFLTDKKVPLRKRKDLIVLASAPSGYKNSNEILFVLGVEISADLKVDEGGQMAKISNYKG
ncbi:MAG: tRNA lysidine(34) synthetase TilS, partial [Clostridia bacterium]|nr:tRNA lysidine(34) synthetase TilS [Clostridia bacterium]